MSDKKKLKLALKALEYIVTNEGRVCDDYENCTHVACSSSYTSWNKAAQALREIRETNESR